MKNAILEKIDHPKPTVLRFLFPSAAISWGVVCLVYDVFAYSTNMKLALGFLPREVWGVSALVVGSLSLIAEIMRVRWLLMVAALVHTLFLAHIAYLFWMISPSGAAWYVNFAVFKFAYMVEVNAAIIGTLPVKGKEVTSGNGG